MKNLLPKIKQDSFLREVLWLLFILVLTLMPHLHLLASDTLSSINLFGLNYEHGYDANQAFFWFQLVYAQLLTFLLILLRFSKWYLGLAVLFPVYWAINGLFWTILPSDILRSNQVLFEASVIFVTLCIGYKFIKTKTLVFIFDRKVSRICLGVVFISLTLILKKLEKMPNTIQKMDFLGFIITSNEFTSAPHFLWILSFKVLLIINLLVLFFRLRPWWRYSFLFPVLLTVFQIKNVVFSESEVMDEYEVFDALPLLLVVLVLLVYLSKSAYYQSRLKRLYRATAFRIQENKESLSGNRLNYLRQKWKEITHSNYRNTKEIGELNDLRKELERQLKQF